MFNAGKVSKQVLEGRLSYRMAVRLFERYLILAILNKFRGNRTQTARFLGIHRNSIRNKLNA